jgi:hypothetical protein
MKGNRKFGKILPKETILQRARKHNSALKNKGVIIRTSDESKATPCAPWFVPIPLKKAKTKMPENTEPKKEEV